MTADAIAWIAAEAGFPMLSEESGALCVNAAAEERIGGARDLTEAVARLTGMAITDSPVVELVRRAKAGLRVTAKLGGLLLLSVPLRSGDVRILAMPDSASVQREREATVTHELANALGAIAGWAELARRADAEGRHIDRALTLIEESARAARATARYLLEEARAGVGVAGATDAVRVITEVIEMLEPFAEAASVHVEALIGRGPLLVATSRAQLHTAISNLLRNAIEASPEGGLVAVEARARRNRVRIEVADQGPGITDEDRARIFEPYFTTKPEGTGLGLPLVRHVVESSAGRLTVRAQPGKGARFIIELPAGEAQRAGVVAPRKPSGVRVRSADLTGNVLVVEDDRSMRELIATTLELHGATVTMAASAEEALAATGPFDVALVDLGLDVRGDRLLAELRRNGRVTLAALVSGSTAAADLHPEGRPQVWVRKPFDVDELVEAVRGLFARAVVQARS